MAALIYKGTGNVVLAGCIALQSVGFSEAAWSEPRTENSTAHPGLPLGERPSLFGGPEARMREKGINFGASFTEFAQAHAAGDGDGDGSRETQFGGKTIAKLTVDGSKSNLWDGFFISMIGEYNAGSNISGTGGTLLPINTALSFPDAEDSGGDLSLTITQFLSKNISLTAGKFNMIDKSAQTPLVGGGGIDTYWYINPAAPITGLVPPYVTGAALAINTRAANYSLMVYDPRGSQQESGFDHWGNNGHTLRASVTLPVRPGGLSGHQTLVLAHNDSRQVDLSDILLTLLPPQLDVPVGTKKGAHSITYSFQQYLWQYPNKSDEGWGIFGQFTTMDGNPTPYEWSAYLGLGGNSPLLGRTQDRLGIVFFDTSFSDTLVDNFRLLHVGIDDERGSEFFYNCAIAPWLRVSAHIQYVHPGLHELPNEIAFDNAAVVGASLQIKL